MEGLDRVIGFHSWRLHLDGANLLKQTLEQEWEPLDACTKDNNALSLDMFERVLADHSETAEKLQQYLEAVKNIERGNVDVPLAVAILRVGLKLATMQNESLMIQACDFSQSQIEKDRPVVVIDQVLDTLRAAGAVAAARPDSSLLVKYIQRLLSILIDLGQHQHNLKKLFLVICERMHEMVRLVHLANEHEELKSSMKQLFSIYAFSDASVKDLVELPLSTIQSSDEKAGRKNSSVSYHLTFYKSLALSSNDSESCRGLVGVFDLLVGKLQQLHGRNAPRRGASSFHRRKEAVHQHRMFVQHLLHAGLGFAYSLQAGISSHPLNGQAIAGVFEVIGDQAIGSLPETTALDPYLQRLHGFAQECVDALSHGQPSNGASWASNVLAALLTIDHRFITERCEPIIDFLVKQRGCAVQAEDFDGGSMELLLKHIIDVHSSLRRGPELLRILLASISHSQASSLSTTYSGSAAHRSKKRKLPASPSNPLGVDSVDDATTTTLLQSKIVLESLQTMFRQLPQGQTHQMWYDGVYLMERCLGASIADLSSLASAAPEGGNSDLNEAAFADDSFLTDSAARGMVAAVFREMTEHLPVSHIPANALVQLLCSVARQATKLVSNTEPDDVASIMPFVAVSFIALSGPACWAIPHDWVPQHLQVSIELMRRCEQAIRSNDGVPAPALLANVVELLLALVLFGECCAVYLEPGLDSEFRAVLKDSFAVVLEFLSSHHTNLMLRLASQLPVWRRVDETLVGRLGTHVANHAALAADCSIWLQPIFEDAAILEIAPFVDSFAQTTVELLNQHLRSDTELDAVLRILLVVPLDVFVEVCSSVVQAITNHLRKKLQIRGLEFREALELAADSKPSIALALLQMYFKILTKFAPALSRDAETTLQQVFVCTTFCALAFGAQGAATTPELRDLLIYLVELLASREATVQSVVPMVCWTIQRVIAEKLLASSSFQSELLLFTLLDTIEQANLGEHAMGKVAEELDAFWSFAQSRLLESSSSQEHFILADALRGRMVTGDAGQAVRRLPLSAPSAPSFGWVYLVMVRLGCYLQTGDAPGLDQITSWTQHVLRCIWFCECTDDSDQLVATIEIPMDYKRFIAARTMMLLLHLAPVPSHAHILELLSSFVREVVAIPVPNAGLDAVVESILLELLRHYPVTEDHGAEQYHTIGRLVRFYIAERNRARACENMSAFMDVLDGRLVARQSIEDVVACGAEALAICEDVLTVLCTQLAANPDCAASSEYVNVFTSCCHLLATTIAIFKGALSKHRAETFRLVELGLDAFAHLLQQQNHDNVTLCRVMARVLYSVKQGHQLPALQYCFLVVDCVRRLCRLEQFFGVKDLVLPALFALFELIDRRDKARIHAALDTEGRAAFAKYSEHYTSDYKYTGQA